MSSPLQGVRAACPQNVDEDFTHALAHALGWDEPYNEDEWGIVEGEGFCLAPTSAVSMQTMFIGPDDAFCKTAADHAYSVSAAQGIFFFWGGSGFQLFLDFVFFCNVLQLF